MAEGLRLRYWIEALDEGQREPWREGCLKCFLLTVPASAFPLAAASHCDLMGGAPSKMPDLDTNSL